MKTKNKKQLLLDALYKANLIKEAKASIALDDCTQCGTIEPLIDSKCITHNTVEPTKVDSIKYTKGCGKPEINSKTGNVSICCGDTLDERTNPETGETEFLNYYCADCKAKRDALSTDCVEKSK